MVSDKSTLEVDFRGHIDAVDRAILAAPVYFAIRHQDDGAVRGSRNLDRLRDWNLFEERD